MYERNRGVLLRRPPRRKRERACLKLEFVGNEFVGRLDNLFLSFSALSSLFFFLHLAALPTLSTLPQRRLTVKFPLLFSTLSVSLFIILFFYAFDVRLLKPIFFHFDTHIVIRFCVQFSRLLFLFFPGVSRCVLLSASRLIVLIVTKNTEIYAQISFPSVSLFAIHFWRHRIFKKIVYSTKTLS